jgi:hypothetical protein
MEDVAGFGFGGNSISMGLFLVVYVAIPRSTWTFFECDLAGILTPVR